MNAHTIRTLFLQFFADHDHRVVPSSSVVPLEDPTLLFTNAGMNQFKDVLLGYEKRDYTRAVSTQKCVRAGGKHNDLDDVGKDARHLTFFEMLGNWSFGDYGKKDAISWAWDFIKNYLKVDLSRVYVTIYKDDDESFGIWRDLIGVEPARILRLGDLEKGDEENFWSMGPTGPCGPCTEIHYDLYPEQGPLTFEVGYPEERVIEFWNLVFMEFNRDEEGVLTPLAMKSVDTGMGLERMAMVMAAKPTVFHTELFTPIFREVRQLAGESIDHERTEEPEWVSFYTRETFPQYAVIADHIRTVTFALADGATFSNEGRGSVLRSILRRAVLNGRRLGFEAPFLYQVSGAVVEAFKAVFPELEPHAAHIAELIRLEEERFFRTIDAGCMLFESVVDQQIELGHKQIDGEIVFKLHATHGFPPDMTRVLAQERGLEVDMETYAEHWRAHQETSKGCKDVYAEVAQLGEWVTVHEGPTSTFVGYHDLNVRTRIMKYRQLDCDQVEFLLEETPFYAESGGQIADYGSVTTESGDLVLQVLDVQKCGIGISHHAKIVKGSCDATICAQQVIACVDASRRKQIACNHTATHLLHFELRHLVSDHVFQAGSLVAPDRLRFDFSHDKPLTPEQLTSIEAAINHHIRQQVPIIVHTDVDREAAVQQMGAMAIFGEKYGDKVRVVEIAAPGLTSIELCGGTHVSNTQELSLFHITSESGVAAGIRRIEAVTSEVALLAMKRNQEILEQVATLLKVDAGSVVGRLQNLLDERHQLSKQVDAFGQKLAASSAVDLLKQAEHFGEITVVSTIVSAQSRDQLLYVADKLRDQMHDGVALLGSTIDGKPTLLCCCTDEFWKRHKIKAGDLINDAARFIDGRGGGRPTLAQAGGTKGEGLAEAIQQFTELLKQRISKQ